MDDELNGLSDNWIEVSPEQEAGARRLRAIYLSLITAGFTEHEVMTIIGQSIASGLA